MTQKIHIYSEKNNIFTLVIAFRKHQEKLCLMLNKNGSRSGFRRNFKPVPLPSIF